MKQLQNLNSTHAPRSPFSPPALAFVAAVLLLVAASFPALLHAQHDPNAPKFDIDLDCTTFAFSPDNHLAFGVRRIFNYKKYTLEGDDLWVATPDGKRKKIVDGEKIVKVPNRPGSYSIHEIWWSPDSRKLIVFETVSRITDTKGTVNAGQKLQLLDANDGHEIPPAPPPPPAPPAPKPTDNKSTAPPSTNASSTSAAAPPTPANQPTATPPAATPPPQNPTPTPTDPNAPPTLHKRTDTDSSSTSSSSSDDDGPPATDTNDKPSKNQKKDRAAAKEREKKAKKEEPAPEPPTEAELNNPLNGAVEGVWLPDGTTVVYLGVVIKPHELFNMHKLTPATGKTAPLFAQHEFADIAWDIPHGTAIAAERDHELSGPATLVSLDLVHETRKEIAPMQDFQGHLVVSRSGRRVAYFSDGDHLQIVNLDSPSKSTVVRAGFGRFEWGRDDNHILLKPGPENRSGTLSWIDISANDFEPAMHDLDYRDFHISPDGQLIGLMSLGKQAIQIFPFSSLAQ